MFIKTAKANLDDVYERIDDCCDMGRIFAADILYHAHCIKSYLYAGKLEAKISTIPPLSCKSRKREIAEKLFMDLQPALLNGDGFTLSEIRDAIKLMRKYSLKKYKTKK